MMVRHLLLGVTALGAGLLLPTAAYSSPVAMVRAAALGLADSRLEADPNPDLYLELPLELEADGLAYKSINFAGTADDVIVVYVEHEDGSPRFSPSATLYTSAGEDVFSAGSYPDTMTFNASLGDYQTFLLPETGSYRLAFGEGPGTLSIDGIPVVDPGYVVQVRSATDYEQWMMSAEPFLEAGDYESALERLALAVDDSPEIPSAHLYRVFAYGEMLYESTDLDSRWEALEAELDGAEDPTQIENALLNVVYETFLTLPVAEQQIVVSDLQQLEKILADEIAQGDYTPVSEFEPFLFGASVEFLTTGVPTEPVRQMLFGVSTTDAPVAPPAEAPVLDEPLPEPLPKAVEADPQS